MCIQLFLLHVYVLLLLGTFSSVYLASVKNDSSVMVALKHIIPTSSTTRIENEIRCLKTMGYDCYMYLNI